MISQAGVNNLSPLLFTTFQRQFGLDGEELALLISLNFGIQLLTDLAAVRFADRFGYRTVAVSAGGFCAAGLSSLGILPFVFEEPYIGLIGAVSINAIGGGLLEVIVSPIIEALPVENKGPGLSLLHSFYCWGVVSVVIFSTGYFSFIGLEHWRFLPFLWAAVPLGSLLLFLGAPLRSLTETPGTQMPLRVLAVRREFPLFFLMMLCAGAAEQAMGQWASFFAETGLGLSKTLGDLLGPCIFAVLMGLSRVYFGLRNGNLPLENVLLGSAGLCFGGYLIAAISPDPLVSLMGCGLCGFSVGIMWPGIFTLAARVFPFGGTGMFGVLALAGDGGCGLGPGLVGFAMQSLPLKAGLFTGAIFPFLLGGGILLLKRRKVCRKKKRTAR
jgi:fucose permease